MSEKPNNPLAFPSHGSMGEVVQEGMTLRDYLAGQAMLALIVREGVERWKLASIAYQIADDMLEERGKSPNEV